MGDGRVEITCLQITSDPMLANQVHLLPAEISDNLDVSSLSHVSHLTSPIYLLGAVFSRNSRAQLCTTIVCASAPARLSNRNCPSGPTSQFGCDESVR